MRQANRLRGCNVTTTTEAVERAARNLTPRYVGESAAEHEHRVAVLVRCTVNGIVRRGGRVS